MASVIFVPHEGRCAECDRYARQLGGAVEGLRQWASRLMLVITPGTETAPAVAGEAPGILLLADRDGAGRARLGVGVDQAAVVQADRWGAVYDVAAAGREATHGANRPTPEDLVALAKFIDIQRPECGIPSKEWLAASPFTLG